MTGVTSRLLPGDRLIDVAAREICRRDPYISAENAREQIARVLDVILDDPVRTELVRAIAVVQGRADIAFMERDDLYDSWDGPEPRARLSLLAIDHAFDQRGEREEDSLSVEQAAAILEDVTYKPNWHFSVYRLPDGPIGVRVEARGLPDTTGRRQSAAAARRAWDRRSILANAMAAVEAVEVHEAREHFRYRGDALFNEHRERDDDLEPPQRA
jgi:hypothetical protein